MSRNIIIYSLLVGISFLLGGILGGELRKASDNRAAIEAGVATWEVDAKTGATTFVFLRPDEPMKHKKDAIEAGVAEWQINPKSGERMFTFKGVAPTMPMSDAEHKKSNGLSIKVGD